MKNLKAFISVICCLTIFLLSSCKGAEGSSTLKIGVDGLQGVFNPFYAQSNADKDVVSQLFRTIQYKDSNNKNINHSGGISYEFVNENQIKYTVSIENDMYFSDGSNITIDDVIFFYHFIADASYDGVYNDWYLNDIVGVKEFYFDDINYRNSIEEIEYKIDNNYTVSTIETDDLAFYLSETMINGKFDGNLDSKSPSGKSWREYLINLGYSEGLNDLGNNPSAEKVLGFVAKAEAECNANSYNPEEWYRNYLYKKYIEKNYSDEISVNSISGIKKINDYTCTVLFNSKNINAISVLNAPLVSKNYFSAEYVKGSADTIKAMSGYDVCSGAYTLSEYSENTVSLSFNKYYDKSFEGFSNLKFIGLDQDDDPVKQVVSGKVDIIRTLADSKTVSAIDGKNVRYFTDDCNYYVSMFFNTRTLDASTRKALIGLCNVNSAVEENIGSYYSRPLRPLSVRFEEYPSSVTEPYYNESAFKVYSMGNGPKVNNISIYYDGSENDLCYNVLSAYKNILSEKGINAEIVLTDKHSLENAVLSGKADLWIEEVYDGNSCDKFEYFNSNGKLNKTGINSAEIDTLTASVRSAVGYSNKALLTSKLMDLVMEQAVECPLYQLQTITVYNTDTIDPNSISASDNSDGYSNIIPYLRKN
ncbi:MAG: ABC transporter substrate-binding protein [Acutalibacteraceae bacterium]|nr:ABC transporter substrate-binding protein [Acutalibacteraceae bacterium]